MKVILLNKLCTCFFAAVLAAWSFVASAVPIQIEYGLVGMDISANAVISDADGNTIDVDSYSDSWFPSVASLNSIDGFSLLAESNGVSAEMQTDYSFGSDGKIEVTNTGQISGIPGFQLNPFIRFDGGVFFDVRVAADYNGQIDLNLDYIVSGNVNLSHWQLGFVSPSLSEVSNQLSWDGTMPNYLPGNSILGVTETYGIQLQTNTWYGMLILFEGAWTGDPISAPVGVVDHNVYASVTLKASSVSEPPLFFLLGLGLLSLRLRQLGSKKG